MNPATWVADEHLDPTHMNSRIRDANTALAKPAYGILAVSADYSVTPNGATKDVLYTNAWTNKMTVTTSNGYKLGLKVTEPGLYAAELACAAQVDGGAPDSHFISFILVNGVYSGRGIFTARDGYHQSAPVKRLLSLNANDVVTSRVFSDSGRTIIFAPTAATADGCRLSLTRIGNYPWTAWP
ncbi:hypothetical protein [Streptomyces sp. URMC 125]|uniref:hypothetical protein n=1 Tax=Streptomyces sp. URMC 125 TaxID=3423419 RepID=UPI003F197435